MRTHAIALVVLLVVIAVVSLNAQSAPPRTADGKPDFSGFWQHPGPPTGRGGATVFDRSKFSPFRPGGEALFFEPRTGDPRHDEPRAFCMPSGFPSGMLAPYPVQIVQTPGWMVMVHEFQRMTRMIPLDGRPHRADVEPTYYGDSVGRWDGETLVIETKNYKRWSLDDWYYQNPKEYRMHSEDLRTVERMRRVDANTISYQFTVDDPKIFTAPWTEDWVMRARPEWEKVGLFEFVCQENNRCEGGNCKQ